MVVDVNAINILLVEDSPGDVRLTQEALREGKVRNNLHVVTDGVEALAFLRHEGKYAAVPRPDVILLDLNLPKKDGREVLAEIKEDDDLRRHEIARRRARFHCGVPAGVKKRAQKRRRDMQKIQGASGV